MPAGEVTTACQDACPTRAIVFGDLNNPGEVVRDFKTDPRHYALLGHLDTRPRTTYLADLEEPEPCARRRRRMSAALGASGARSPVRASRGSRPSTRATPPSRPP